MAKGAKVKGKKEVIGEIKLHIQAGKANPSPPVGPALAQHGVNIMEFCKAFNDRTKKMDDMVIPVVISVHKDKSFEFITKSPPASRLLLKACGIAKGSAEPNKSKVAKITRDKIEEIANTKMADLSALDMENAARTIIGTAKSMGIDVV